jgi:hypothetical protein
MVLRTRERNDVEDAAELGRTGGRHPMSEQDNMNVQKTASLLAFSRTA